MASIFSPPLLDFSWLLSKKKSARGNRNLTGWWRVLFRPPQYATSQCLPRTASKRIHIFAREPGGCIFPILPSQRQDDTLIGPMPTAFPDGLRSKSENGTRALSDAEVLKCYRNPSAGFPSMSQMKRFFIADDDMSGAYAELDMKQFSDVSELSRR